MINDSRALLLADPPPPPAPEKAKGFNLVTVLYYFGALLMISACAWFLGAKWDVLGASGICITAIIYASITASTGLWLRRQGYVVAGGLLVTVAVSLTPLLIYSIERMTGFWPADDPGAYRDFYPLIHGSWVVMELATIAAAAFALKFVRFSFLTAPMAFCFWFLSMDLAAWIFRHKLSRFRLDEMGQRAGRPRHDAGRLWTGSILEPARGAHGRRLRLLVLPVWADGFLGRFDGHGLRLGVKTVGLFGDQPGPDGAGNQIETDSLYGIRRFGSLRIPRSSGVDGVQRFCAISVRAGTAGIEPDSGARLRAALPEKPPEGVGLRLHAIATSAGSTSVCPKAKSNSAATSPEPAESFLKSKRSGSSRCVGTAFPIAVSIEDRT